MNEQTLYSKLSEIIARIIELVNVDSGKNLTVAQTVFIVETIMQDYWMYSLEDVQLCIQNGCRGRYGQIFNRIDPSVVLAWFTEYEKERQAEIRRRQKEQQDADSENLYNLFQTPVMKEILTEVTDRLAHKERKEPEPYTPPKKHPIQEQIEAQWNNLPIMWDGGKPNYHVRTYGTTVIGFDEFYKIRWEEIMGKDYHEKKAET